ncbi:MAG: hypothetical protein JNK82_42115 [Myxococcaceae bacterium]|nr:hypothetical protein [Myxococcaceae bacterium]
MVTALVLVLSAAWSCDQEDGRVRAHLEDAYTQLVTSPPPQLTEAQRARRADALSALRRYIDAGRFPRNRVRASPTPVFVDEVGTHCAMGALISQLGGDPVVQHVRSTRNLATVPTLADEPGLLEWLDAYGFAPEEAALVQPTYFSCEPVFRQYFSQGPAREAVVVPFDGGDGVGYVVTRAEPAPYLCEGSRTEWSSRPSWPIGTVVALPHALAHDGSGWAGHQYRNCAWRPLLTDGDGLRQRETWPIEWHLDVFRHDPRWFIIQCHRNFGAPDLDFCSPDGRFQSGVLPARGTMRQHVLAWLQRVASVAGQAPVTEASLADAGVDLALIDAIEAQVWAFSDDGGEPLDAGVRPVMQWSGPLPDERPCDAGRPDAGSADAGRADAGTTDAGHATDAGAEPDSGSQPPADAGVLTDAGTADAGPTPTLPTEPMLPGGCGCASSPLALVLGALALVLRRRRQTKGFFRYLDA